MISLLFYFRAPLVLLVALTFVVYIMVSSFMAFLEGSLDQRHHASICHVLVASVLYGTAK